MVCAVPAVFFLIRIKAYQRFLGAQLPQCQPEGGDQRLIVFDQRRIGGNDRAVCEYGLFGFICMGD